MEQKKIIISKVKRSKKGTIFLPDSFMPIDVQYASNVLGQLVKEGVLMRVSQGIYIKPKMTRFGPLMPTLYVLDKQARHKPTVGFGGFYSENSVHCEF